MSCNWFICLIADNLHGKTLVARRLHTHTHSLSLSIPLPPLFQAVLLLSEEALYSSLNGVPLYLLVCRSLPSCLQVKLFVVIDHCIGLFSYLLLLPSLQDQVLAWTGEGRLPTLKCRVGIRVHVALLFFWYHKLTTATECGVGPVISLVRLFFTTLSSIDGQ